MGGKPAFRLIKLTPKGPRLTFKEELPRSDTLMGAMVWALRELGLGFQRLLCDPPFVLSSVFPGDETGPLLPAPLPKPEPPEVSNLDGYRKAKEVKKLSRLPLEEWKRLVRGEAKLGELAGENGGERGERVRERLRAAVDRLGVRANLFGTRYSATRVGWVVAGVEEGSEGELMAGLRLLGERGLSGGVGQFEPEIKGELRGYDGDTRSGVLLSLWLPTEKEIDRLKDPRYRWKLALRSGRLHSPHFGGTVFKRPAMVITEGSVVPKDARGKTADVRPYGFKPPNDWVCGGVMYMGWALVVPIKEDADES